MRKTICFSSVFVIGRLIGLSYYAGCILLLKCNFIDYKRSININSCFMRKLIPARVRASALFFFCAVCAAGSKHKHTYRIIHRIIHQEVHPCAFSKRMTHDIFALLYLDITIPVKILNCHLFTEDDKNYISVSRAALIAENNTIIKYFLSRQEKKKITSCVYDKL